jgi:hypothetical protein
MNQIPDNSIHPLEERIEELEVEAQRLDINNQQFPIPAALLELIDTDKE